MVRFARIFICWLFCHTLSWAEEGQVSLLYSDSLPKEVLSFYQKQGFYVRSVDINTSPSCDSVPTIAIGNRAFLYARHFCQQGPVLGVFTYPNDQSSKWIQETLASSPGIYPNIELAARYFERIGVVYSENIEEEGILLAKQKLNRRLILAQKISNKREAIKAIGKLSSEVDAIVLGESPEFFENQTLITASKISIKYRKPLIGGRYLGLIKKGVAIGIYANPYQSLSQSVEWILNPESQVKNQFSVEKNPSLVRYFGIEEREE